MGCIHSTGSTPICASGRNAFRRQTLRHASESMFSPVRADPVSGRDQYRPVQQRGQAKLDRKLAALHWTVLVETSPFLLMLPELPSTTTNSVIEGKWISTCWNPWSFDYTWSNSQKIAINRIMNKPSPLPLLATNGSSSQHTVTVTQRYPRLLPRRSKTRPKETSNK